MNKYELLNLSMLACSWLKNNVIEIILLYNAFTELKSHIGHLLCQDNVTEANRTLAQSDKCDHH
jgi:hypothetical protein